MGITNGRKIQIEYFFQNGASARVNSGYPNNPRQWQQFAALGVWTKSLLADFLTLWGFGRATWLRFLLETRPAGAWQAQPCASRRSPRAVTFHVPIDGGHFQPLLP
jgi:hypothetical protein